MLNYRTEDNTPPAAPEPGQMRVGRLAEGRAPVTGGLGATEPDTLVSVTNLRSGVIESQLSGEDGSFALDIAAGLLDELELTLRDRAGNTQTLTLGRPEPPPGTAVLGEEGGVLSTEEGVRLRFPGAVMPDDSIVRMRTRPASEVPNPFSEQLPGKVLGAVDLDMGGVEIPPVASLELAVEGLPEYAAEDRVPLFRIQRSIRVPEDWPPGTPLKLRLQGLDAAGGRNELLAELPIVNRKKLGKPQPRTETRSGSPSLSLTLPERAAPGQTVELAAAADPPYLKLGFPVEEALTGDEQFLLFEVRDEGQRQFWNLADIAKVRPGPDGKPLVETSSPPYRGIRKDRSQLIMVMFYQASVSFVQVLHSTVSADSPQAVIDAFVDLPGQAAPFGTLISLGADLRLQLNNLELVQHSLYEFSVVPVLAGVPGTIQVQDARTNRETYRMQFDALPPGAMSSVVVLGDDPNPLQVTATSAQNNHSVPLDAGMAVAFSHLIDTASVDQSNLMIKDPDGRPVPARIRFQERKDKLNYLAHIKPLHRLKAGRRYTLVATSGIRRPGDDQGAKSLRKPFEMPFTTAPPPQVVGRLELPGARSFDLLGDTALIAQTDIAAGLNRFVTADLENPARPKVLAELPFNVNKSGPLWEVKALPKVNFKGRNGLPVEGDLAILSLGNGGVFSTVRALDVSKPERPKALTNAIVSLPLDVIHEKAKLIVMPTLGGWSGPSLDINATVTYGAGGFGAGVNAGISGPSFDPNIQSVEVREAYGANTTGIPQTTAIPRTIDTHDQCRGPNKADGEGTEPAEHCWIYFVNQGLGVMTIDLARSIPPPPPNQRGHRFGPSYLPKDKAGALVFRDDPSLLERSETFSIERPAHLAFVGEKQRVSGNIRDDKLAKLLINGYRAELQRDGEGRPIAFEVELPMREGANQVLAEAFGKGGNSLGRARIWLLREYAANPLAGSGKVRIDLPPLQVTGEASIRVTARVEDVLRFDEILVNAQIASRKACSPYANPARSSCGWEGVGEVSVPLKPGINSIVATTIDVDEEFPESLFYADLRVQEGLAVAVKNDLFLFDASGVQLMHTVPIGSAHRVSLAQGVHVDLDGDGRLGLDETEDDDELTQFHEQMNLALVGERGGGLSFIDITEPHKAKRIGRMPVDGPVFRAEYLRDQGIALVAAADAVLLVDLARAAAKDGLLDEDGDGQDDRILERVPLPGARDLRLSRDQALVTVLQWGQGLTLLRLAPCQQDLAVDASFIVKERLVNYASIQDTRDRLHQLLADNLGSGECADFPLDSDQAGSVGLLAQGSSACIWRADLACSSAYQPGLSDYDIELVVGDGELDQAQQCADALEAEIRTDPLFKVGGVSLFPVPRSALQSAYRDVAPRRGKCGAGEDDPYADLCLGRNGLLLKWLLEGEWVNDGQGKVYDGGLSLDAALDLLNDPVEPPQGDAAPPGSRRFDLASQSWVNILNAGAPRRDSHVPLLETSEWACLQDYALNAAKSRLRIKGSGIGDVPIQDPLFLKKVQKAAKAGIRAVYGHLLGSPEGNSLLLEVTREHYNSGRGCFTAVDDPDQVSSLDDFDYKPCESFTEYVASQALLSASRDLKLLGDSADEQARNALFAYEMFRRKADVGRQITDETAANEFLLRVMDYIGELGKDDDHKRRHRDNLADYTDGGQRGSNLEFCRGERLPAVSPGGKEFKLQVPVRLYNNGLRGLAGAELAFYHDSQLERSIFADLAPGESQFIAKEKKSGKPAEGERPEPERYVFEVEPKSQGAHKIQFLADPEDQLTEFDKANNFDGFYYYVLNPGAAPNPPATSGDRPEPPKELVDPPASPSCLVEGKAPPSVRLDLLASIDDQYSASLPPEGQGRLGWLLRNQGNVALEQLLIEDSLAGEIQADQLAPGQTLSSRAGLSGPQGEGAAARHQQRRRPRSRGQRYRRGLVPGQG